ncbi:unnamed protein product [Rotaria sp. Silwood2]|nr:unnamed protein product [Rotaria sp. Silwood2]CAF2818118.1 unnamed protein product [Rotaria sp. Silwood2]CAF3244861.1 unnamed protein product [Rotaria sp. Silwood2]CAF4246556.1 unnamed protein product [Rotaria sp. Silwood2]CAF4401630.1 unnamed protein product [Rotaria sp. Silwood2]
MLGFSRWQWSRPLHYINIPPWSCNYVHERDCINDICTYGALKNYSTRLMTYKNGVQHQQDFFFLVHFASDIHQPLHVGFKDDAGGNGITVRFMNTSTNLHSLWDTGILSYRLRNTFQSNINSYYDYLYLKMLNQTVEMNNDSFMQWIVESIDIVCKQVYFDEMNVIMNSSTSFNLSHVYYERSWPVVEKRLIQAGYRLGALLNRILKTHTESTTPTPPTTTITNESCQNAAFSSPFSILILLLVLSVLSYLFNEKI